MDTARDLYSGRYAWRNTLTGRVVPIRSRADVPTLNLSLWQFIDTRNKDAQP